QNDDEWENAGEFGQFHDSHTTARRQTFPYRTPLGRWLPTEHWPKGARAIAWSGHDDSVVLGWLGRSLRRPRPLPTGAFAALLSQGPNIQTNRLSCSVPTCVWCLRVLELSELGICGRLQPKLLKSRRRAAWCIFINRQSHVTSAQLENSEP